MQQHGAEGIVATDKAVVKMHSCSIEGCKGPAIDLSGQASACMELVNIKNNVGECNAKVPCTAPHADD
jgi:hypothetical protein